LRGPYGNYDRPVQAARISALWRERFGIDAPRKIICVGLNYRDHAVEQGAELPEEPLLFAKFANALLDPGEAIPLPAESSHVDAEAELAVVIGAPGRRVPENEALGLVAGYTCANDVSARDLQRRDRQWLRAKSFDGFCPLLPELASVDELGDAAALRVVQRLNGDTLQDGTTSDLIFGVPRIVAHASSVFTLDPGDVILTGTPAGVGVHRDPPVSLKSGDTVEVEIERIGVLPNPVVSER
jgi:2-keto-4-pentenoate hydratase/2-oxohepta-3-ene-1,7-dioic acid hydratase in catechol pathway